MLYNLFRPSINARDLISQDATCEGGNTYGLPVGQRIKVVFVESITPDLRAAGVISSK